MKNKAIFLDRDGVLNRELGDYVCREEDFHILDHNFPALRELQSRGYLLIVVTNQGGIAKGLYSEEMLKQFHKKMCRIFVNEGIVLTTIYYCPHHPDFTGPCSCRKPEPGMLLQAIKAYDIDPTTSYFIGDNERDRIAGEQAGVIPILITSDQPLASILHLIA